jgi:hypothetical protein
MDCGVYEGYDIKIYYDGTIKAGIEKHKFTAKYPYPALNVL